MVTSDPTDESVGYFHSSALPTFELRQTDLVVECARRKLIEVRRELDYESH